MSRPQSSSAVYGLTVAIVGTLDRITNVGMISKSEATSTATVVQTVKRSGRRSHLRCHQSVEKTSSLFAASRTAGSWGWGRTSGATVSRSRGGASWTSTSYSFGRVCHVRTRL